MTDRELLDISRHAQKWAHGGGLLRNRKLVELIGLDPERDRIKIAEYGLCLEPRATRGRAVRTRARVEIARNLLSGGELSIRELASRLTALGLPTSRGTAANLRKVVLTSSGANGVAAGSQAPLEALKADNKPPPPYKHRSWTPSP